MTEKEIYRKGKFELKEWEDVNYCEHTFSMENEDLSDREVVDLLNGQEETIERMKFAFKRKFGYDIEDVVDEICDEDYTVGDKV